MVDRRDEMLVAVGLGAAAFGYWYVAHKNSTETTAQSSDISGDTESDSTVYYQGMDTSSSNVMTPAQIFQNGVGTTTVRGSVASTQSQTFTLPMNS